MKTNASNLKKVGKKTQERTEITRTKLLGAAQALFIEQGFEGVSIRDIENEAGVQRGLLVYHFESKEALWKQMADGVFSLMQQDLEPRMEIIADLPPREKIAFIIRFYVRFSSRRPQFARLLTQEARHPSWRIRYLVETHIESVADTLREPVTEALGLTETQFMHWYYMLAGGSSLIFSHAPECELLFGVDSINEDVVEKHAEMLVNSLLGPSA